MPQVSEYYSTDSRDTERDRQRTRRDHLVHALREIGGQVTTKRLAQHMGLSLQVISLTATKWPRYFVYYEACPDDSVELHPHLRNP
jgi:hypothetical protein